MPKTLKYLVLLIVLACAPSQVSAQERGAVPRPQSSEIVEQQTQILANLQKQTDALSKQIDDSSDSDAKLVDIRLQLEDMTTQLLQSAVAFRPRLTDIGARLEQIGAPPASGQPPESDIVATERKALNDEKAEINVLIGQAEDLSIRVRAMLNRIAVQRSEIFRGQFTKRYDLVDAFGQQTLTDANREITTLYRSVSSWATFVIQYKFRAVLGATFMALAAAAVLLFGGRRLFGRSFEADAEAEDPTYLSRLSVAFWSTLIPTAALLVFFSATVFFYNYFNVLRPDIEIYLGGLFFMVLMVFCVNRLVGAVLSPKLPKWRLVAVSSQAGRLLVGIATAMATVLGVVIFLRTVNDQLGSPLSITIARSFVATVVIGVLIVMVALIRPFRDEEGRRKSWPLWARLFLYMLGAFVIVAALLGYIPLAVFLSVQVVITGTLLLTAYIGFLSARAIGAEEGFANTRIGQRLAARGMSEQTLDQLGLVVSVAINLLIVALFLPMTLFMWGFQPGDIQAWIYRLATGVQIGSINISLTGILTGIVVFIGGYFLTRWFQGWLDESVMARGKVDLGVRNSIRTVVGYAGLGIAGLIAISAAGFNLASLALVAGGLSLGIGFGLQNIVQNFVSGLILLAERPFKSGDWITTTGVAGTVKKISVRATEIETFQRQTMIVPNSLLINNAVGNWTHRNKLGRVDVPVNITSGKYARRAFEIMTEVAKGHPAVLKNPEPMVVFVGFSDTSFQFEIRVFLADILASIAVQNEIRFQVVERFLNEEITMIGLPAEPIEVPPQDVDLTEESLTSGQEPEPDVKPRRKPSTKPE